MPREKEKQTDEQVQQEPIVITHEELINYKLNVILEKLIEIESSIKK